MREQEIARGMVRSNVALQKEDEIAERTAQDLAGVQSAMASQMAELQFQAAMGNQQAKLAYEDMQRQYDQWAGGLDLQRQVSQADIGLGYRSFDEGRRQFDTNLSYQQALADAENRLAWTQFGEGQRQFGMQFGEGQRQFDESMDFQRGQLDNANDPMLAVAGMIRENQMLPEGQRMAPDELNHFIFGTTGVDIGSAPNTPREAALRRSMYGPTEPIDVRDAGGYTGKFPFMSNEWLARRPWMGAIAQPLGIPAAARGLGQGYQAIMDALRGR